MGAVPLKDCPSCGSRIPEPAATCTVCRSGLGRCSGCNLWLVIGTECFDCGGSTAIRIRKASAAPADGPPPSSMEIDASPMGLLPLLALRFLLFAGFLACVAVGIAGAPFPQLARITDEYLRLPKADGGPVAWAAAASLLVAVGACGTLIRRYRLNHTQLLGKPVEAGFSAGALVMNLLLTVLVLGLTAGLGFPWLYARYRR